MADALIFDAVRTPRGRGKASGSLHEVTPIRLASKVLEATRDRNDLDTSRVDDVIMGVVSPVGEQGADIARIAVIEADYDEKVAGVQINRFCASGLEALNMSAAQIMAGQNDLMIAGGVESMSRVSLGQAGGAWSTDPQVAFHSYFVPQGVSADLIATMEGFSRSDVDEYAVRSQKLASAARDDGRFNNSLIAINDINGELLLDQDEHIRTGTTVDDLSELKPAFTQLGQQYGFDSVAIQRYPEVAEIHHVHHAGNSSGIVDGASAILVGTPEIGSELGLTPRARIRAFASIGTEPTIMLTGPAPAAKKALKRAGMTIDDIDLFEVNEAFAAVVLKFMRETNAPLDKINVNGGAIAMGHPLGATGAMLVGTVLDELERRDLNTALITLCIGAGMGTATIIERV
ncbi:MAG: acetyl-CoA C-acetyltransferase [Immundisolibacteraceae bacterium]|nr:acetyl-CoA C-acetyltransferase [Immundisolibacteraceae bacterium]